MGGAASHRALALLALLTGALGFFLPGDSHAASVDDESEAPGRQLTGDDDVCK